AECHSALFHVRAGDVDLYRVDRGLVEAPRHFDVLLDRRAAYVGNEARLGEIQLAEDAAHHLIHPRILQSDRIEHAGRRLVHTMRRVTGPGREGRAFEYDRSSIAVREALDARVL